MQTLGLDSDNDSTEPPKKFWARQFQETPTDSQKVFDWVFGVVMPVICFFFDPIVFRGQFWGIAMFAGYKPFAYILSFAAIMTMLGWLLWRERLKWLGAPLAGIFFVSGIVSLWIGVWIFPISLLGSIMLIGLLGFTPLLTSVIYLRNALRAYLVAGPHLQKRIAVYLFALSGLFAVVVPVVINAEIAKSVEAITTGDEQTFHTEARKLRFVSVLVNFDQLALHYHRLPDGERQTERAKAIAEFYKEMTGQNMGDSASVLMD